MTGHKLYGTFKYEPSEMQWSIGSILTSNCRLIDRIGNTEVILKLNLCHFEKLCNKTRNHQLLQLLY